MSKDDIVIGAGFKQLTSCFSIGLQYGESGPQDRLFAYLVGAEQFYISISRDHGPAGFKLIHDDPDVVPGVTKHCMHGIA
jgi:hypothetical protein